MRVAQIYIIKCPITLGVMYVGQTVNQIHLRFAQHLSTPSNKALSKWILELRSAGKEPIVEPIEKCDPSVRLEREDFWVKHYISIGANLFNVEKDNSLAIAKEKVSPKFDSERFGKDVKEKRGVISLRELSKKLDLSVATMSRIEQGTVPKLSTYAQVCEWLGVKFEHYIIWN